MAPIDYIYGTEPNSFLRVAVAGIPIGDVLCLADGEGRNGVFLAGLGHRVTSVDITEAGMAKAARLAKDRGIDLETIVADLGEFDLGESRWDLIVSIFAHTPPSTRARVHGSIARRYHRVVYSSSRSTPQTRSGAVPAARRYRNSPWTWIGYVQSSLA